MASPTSTADLPSEAPQYVKCFARTLFSSVQTCPHLQIRFFLRPTAKLQAPQRYSSALPAAESGPEVGLTSRSMAPRDHEPRHRLKKPTGLPWPGLSSLPERVLPRRIPSTPHKRIRARPGTDLTIVRSQHLLLRSATPTQLEAPNARQTSPLYRQTSIFSKWRLKAAPRRP